MEGLHVFQPDELAASMAKQGQHEGNHEQQVKHVAELMKVALEGNGSHPYVVVIFSISNEWGLRVNVHLAHLNVGFKEKVTDLSQINNYSIGMTKKLFGNVQMRWNEDSFPFTDPSFELEIFYRNQWMEVLGCGVVHEQILKNCSLYPR